MRALLLLVAFVALAGCVHPQPRDKQREAFAATQAPLVVYSGWFGR